MPPTSAPVYPSSSQPAQRARPRALRAGLLDLRAGLLDLRAGLRAPRTSAQGRPTAITIPPATASSQYQPV